MTEKALLLLTGGRPLPDMLVIKHWKPDIVFNITTERGLNTAKNFRDFVWSQFSCKMEILPAIDPYKEEEITERCQQALKLRPDAEWVIHCTTSPKVAGIYAHYVAREQNTPYWILDTARAQMISLIRPYDVNTEELFKASVKEYMGAYERVCEIPRGEGYQKRTESWFPVVELLLRDHEATQVLLTGLRKAWNDKPAHPLTPTIGAQAKKLVQDLSDYGFLTITQETKESISCTIADEEDFQFLNGDWLEFYVWREAKNEGFADDCQWGHKIVVDQRIATTLPSNELDVALTYKARLLIAECKTSKKPFGSPEDLDKLYSIANLLGGDFVRQVFITNCPQPDERDKGLKDQFDNFKRQAEIRRITVITGDQLPDAGKLLRQKIGADRTI